MQVIDLFCGAGGFSHGFQRAGHTIVAGIDNDPRVKETYEYNHPNTKFILADIQNLDPVEIMIEGEPIELSTIDIVIGSPPCPEFSKAKSNRDPNKGLILVQEFLEWVRAINPKWWIMENVDTVKPYLDKTFPKKRILDAANFGVAQFRKRCFAGNYKVPLPTHARVPAVTFDNRKLKKWRTVRDAIGDLLELPLNFIMTDQRGNIENCKANSPTYDASNRPSRTLTNVPQRIICNLEELNTKVLKKHPPMQLDKPARGIIANLKRGGQYGLVEIPNQECFDNLREFNFDHANREVQPNKPAPTITTKFRCAQKIKTGNKKYRRLTVRECARLQSFPDDFIFFGSKSAKYTMVGNAVPPLLAFHLAKMLK